MRLKKSYQLYIFLFHTNFLYLPREVYCNDGIINYEKLAMELFLCLLTHKLCNSVYFSVYKPSFNWNEPVLLENILWMLVWARPIKIHNHFLQMFLLLQSCRREKKSHWSHHIFSIFSLDFLSTKTCMTPEGKIASFFPFFTIIYAHTFLNFIASSINWVMLQN